MSCFRKSWGSGIPCHTAGRKTPRLFSSEIINFDSKGYEKSIGFDHSLLKDVPKSINKMIAGNIKIENIPDFKNTPYIIDVSGALESEKGIKDINKIDKFLNSVHNN